MSLPLCIVAALLMILVAVLGNSDQDRVWDLPGWGRVQDLKLYSGYINVDETAGRSTFYILVEALQDPRHAPVIMWLNGGPGCSSVGGGFLSELGPWRPTHSGSLLWNPHAWNNFANVLFIESPHGVGFSYSRRKEDLITGDERTAADSYRFLVRFFQKYPHFAGNDFVLAGESYAGHYVPQLALKILQGNQQSVLTGRGPVVALVGTLVGNPLTVPSVEGAGAVDFWWGRGMISDASAEGLNRHCNFTELGPLQTGPPGGLQGDDDEYHICNNFVLGAIKELGHINLYDIYSDVCMEIKRGGAQRMMAGLLGSHPAGMAARAAVAVIDRARDALLGNRTALPPRPVSQPDVQATEDAAHGTVVLGARASSLHAVHAPVAADSARRDDDSGAGRSDDYSASAMPDPCLNDEVQQYLNRPEVQKALHANQSEEARRHLPRRWEECSYDLDYSVRDTQQSMLPLYRTLLKANLSMLVYSGDVDGIVPIIGTRRWVSSLKLTEKVPWHAWIDHQQQVGGYMVEYEGLTFATVRNAGHMVPYSQPQRINHLLKAFLARVGRR